MLYGLKDELSVKWFADGKWNKAEVTEVDVPATMTELKVKRYAAENKDFRMELLVRSEESTAGGASRVAVAEAVVIPLHESATISGLQLVIGVDEELACAWKPHLAPKEDMVIGDKMFHSPALIFEDSRRMMALVPDIAVLEQDRPIPHIMDYTLQDHSIMYGLCEYLETGHVYHQLTPEPVALTEPLTFQFYWAEWTKSADQRAKDYRPVERFLWEKFAQERMPIVSEDELVAELKPYTDYAYGWALDRWQEVTWQQFTLDEVEVGGVVFIVCAWQKPGGGQEEVWREPKSLWNQAWFCGLRTAYGYAMWGRESGNQDWQDKAEKALSFALAAPQTGGLFPGYYQAGEDNRWESGRWYMSGPRRPEGHEDYVHLLDSSWTCYWLLKWYRDVNADPRILPYVRNYIDRLLSLQLEDGGFPAWVNPTTSEISPFLLVSPESAAHIMLLCLWNEIESDSRSLSAAARAADMIIDKVIPEGLWEDFETYWSCSKQWEGKQYGVRDERSGLYNQCSFGMYWAAEAFKDLFKATGEQRWLDSGEQVLAEASLYQQIWKPSFLPVPTVGGFGVMNSDDEWNDARQSLFALTYLDYYQLTNNESYRARATWAMRSSFYMMYCPLNPEVKKLYEKVHPHFDEQDYGFHMENFNHHDGTQVGGLGEFTIFDWGCGAASASLVEFAKAAEPAAK